MKVSLLLTAVYSTAAALQIATVYRYTNPTTHVVSYLDQCPSSCTQASSGKAFDGGASGSISSTNGGLVRNNAPTTGAGNSGGTGQSGQGGNTGLSSVPGINGFVSPQGNGVQVNADGGVKVFTTVVTAPAVTRQTVIVQAGETITSTITVPASVQTQTVTTTATQRFYGNSSSAAVHDQQLTLSSLSILSSAATSASVVTPAESSTPFDTTTLGSVVITSSTIATSSSAATAAPSPATILFRATEDPSMVMVAMPADDDSMTLVFADEATSTPARFIVGSDNTLTEATTGFQLVSEEIPAAERKRGLFSSNRFVLQRPGTSLLAIAIRLAIQDAIMSLFFGSPPRIAELAFNAQGTLFCGDTGFAAANPSLGLVSIAFSPVQETIPSVSTTAPVISTTAQAPTIGAGPATLTKDIISSLSSPTAVPSISTAIFNTASASLTFSSAGSSSAGISSSAPVVANATSSVRTTSSSVPTATPSTVAKDTFVYLKVDNNDPSAYVIHERVPKSTPEQFKIGTDKVLVRLMADGTLIDWQTGWKFAATYDAKFNNMFRYSSDYYFPIDVMTAMQYRLVGNKISFFFGPTNRPGQILSDSGKLLYISDPGQTWPGESVVTLSVEYVNDGSSSSSSSTKAPAKTTVSSATASATSKPPAVDKGSRSRIQFAYLKIAGTTASYVNLGVTPYIEPEQFQIGNTKEPFQFLADATMRVTSMNWDVSSQYSDTQLNAFKYSQRPWLTSDNMTLVRNSVKGDKVYFYIGPYGRAANLYTLGDGLLFIGDEGQYDKIATRLDIVLEAIPDAASTTTVATSSKATTIATSSKATTSSMVTLTLSASSSSASASASATATPPKVSTCPPGYADGAYVHGVTKYSISCSTTALSATFMASSSMPSVGTCMSWCESYGASCVGFLFNSAQGSGYCTLYSAIASTQPSTSVNTIAIVTGKLPASCPSGYSAGPFAVNNVNMNLMCGTTLLSTTFLSSTQYSDITSCINWFLTWGPVAVGFTFDLSGPYQSCQLFSAYSGTAMSSTGTAVIRV